MSVETPGKCPDCQNDKWQIYDFDVKESFVDFENDKNKQFIPAGTLVRQFTCSECKNVIRHYQFPK